MLNTLSARATFYDIIGYFVPGLLTLGVGLVCMRILGGQPLIDNVYGWTNDHWFATSIIGVALSYIAGHCANSCSSWLLEKIIFKDQFAEAANWYKRLLDKSPERGKVIKSVVKAELNIDLSKLEPFDLMIRMEEFFPRATISGFSFLCFYGMCRTLALLSWLAALPISIMLGTMWSGDTIEKVVASVVASVIMCAVGSLFFNQYIRFVRYYYDFLASTLMFFIGKKKNKLP